MRPHSLNQFGIFGHFIATDLQKEHSVVNYFYYSKKNTLITYSQEITQTMAQKSRFTGASRRSSSHSSSHQVPPTQQQTRNYSTSSTPQQQARPQQQTTTPPPPQYQQAPVQSGGSGIMGNIVSTVAGTMIGHAIYDSVSNAFGSKDNAGEQQPQYSPQEMQKCFSQMQSFSQCLEQNPYSIGSCQYAFDQLNDCKRGLTPMPQQPQTNQNNEW